MMGAWGSVVVKALCYKSEGPGINSQCRRDFSHGIWQGPTQPLKVSTRISLKVKAAGA